MTNNTIKSFQLLPQTIHSLVGFKAKLTSSWIDSVCDIIKSSLSQVPSIRNCENNSNHNNDPETDISIVKDELDTLTATIHRLNLQRRQVLNEFLDLKGNIRVFCRLRTILDDTRAGLKRVLALDSNSFVINFAGSTKTYTFDKVFKPGSSQDEIFLEVEPIIKSALEGYNACIFAYGQTGTGKTFTMEGTMDFPGLVPRAIETLFTQAANGNYRFLFTFSMVEIYMGHLRDLLILEKKQATRRKPPCLSIQTDPGGGVVIENLVAIQVNDVSEAMKLYRLGCNLRSTSSTNSNQTSSRSHSMIRISISTVDSTERRRKTNKLWMVDLGGSERVLKTKAQGRAFEEGKAINLSLSALADVIHALRSKREHIPFRNSKLTQVLKDSLGEHSKTLMIVHVSPRAEDLCETLCSLNFASRARSIHVGTDESTEERLHKEVRMDYLQHQMKQIEVQRDEVRREIKRLNEKLENLTGMPASSSEQHSFLPLEVSRSTTEALRKVGSRSAPSQHVPGFMRPTICSRRKSGVELRTSNEKAKRLARKIYPPSARAESANFPIGHLLECSFTSSACKTCCMVGLNTKSSADNGTEYSQVVPEYDDRMASFEEQKKLETNSSHQKRYLNPLQLNYGNTNANRNQNLSKVERWLQLQEDAPKTIRTTNSHHNKRVLALPTPRTKNETNQQYREVHIRSNNEMFKHGEISSGMDISRWFISEAESGPVPVGLKYSADTYSSTVISLSCMSSANMLTEEEISLVSDSSIDKKIFNNVIPSIERYHMFDEGKDGNKARGTPTEIIAGRTSFPETSKLNGNWKKYVPGPNMNDGVTSIMESRLISGSSKSGRESQIGYVETEFHQTSDKRMEMRCQHLANAILTCMDKMRYPCDLTEVKEAKQSAGLCKYVKERTQMLCAGALLGLGLHSLGLGHEFFYALTL